MLEVYKVEDNMVGIKIDGEIDAKGMEDGLNKLVELCDRVRPRMRIGLTPSEEIFECASLTQILESLRGRGIICPVSGCHGH